MVCLNVPNNICFLHYILCFSFHFPEMYWFIRLFFMADPYFSFIHVMFSIGAVMLLNFSLGQNIDCPMWISSCSISSFFFAQKHKESSFFNIFATVVQVGKVRRMHLGLFSIKTSSAISVRYKIMCCISGYIRLSFYCVNAILFSFLPDSLPPPCLTADKPREHWNESDDPETGYMSNW